MIFSELRQGDRFILLDEDAEREEGYRLFIVLHAGPAPENKSPHAQPCGLARVASRHNACAVRPEAKVLRIDPESLHLRHP